MPLPAASQDVVHIVNNALTESRVLHARNVCDILLSSKSGSDNDDVRLKDLLPGFKSDHTKQLRKAYFDGPKDERPHWIFNKMLAHPTTERYDRYDYGPALARLAPHITRLLEEIADARLPTTSDVAPSTPPAPSPTE